MATDIIHDLYDGKTIFIIGGSKEFLFFNAYEQDGNGNPTRIPLDLSNINEIEWLCAPYSVRKEKNVAKLIKTLSSGDIAILRDTNGNYTNRIQIVINNTDTENLIGGFLHQIVITDGGGTSFVPFEGIVVINKRIKTE